MIKTAESLHKSRDSRHNSTYIAQKKKWSSEILEQLILYHEWLILVWQLAMHESYMAVLFDESQESSLVLGVLQTCRHVCSNARLKQLPKSIMHYYTNYSLLICNLGVMTYHVPSHVLKNEFTITCSVHRGILPLISDLPCLLAKATYLRRHTTMPSSAWSGSVYSVHLCKSDSSWGCVRGTWGNVWDWVELWDLRMA